MTARRATILGRLSYPSLEEPLLPGTDIASFLSEHTAEFILAPQAAEVFSRFAKAAVPIYYWSTREGSRVGRECAPNRHVRVVSIFARRPKVTVPGQSVIVAKLNQELFTYSEEATERGIPTLAGIPLVSSLDQLTASCPSVWFRLLDAPSNDMEIPLALNGERREGDDPTHIEGPSQLENLAAKAVSKATAYEWRDALDTLRELRRVGHPNGFFHFLGGYKPFHVLLLQ